VAFDAKARISTMTPSDAARIVRELHDVVWSAGDLSAVDRLVALRYVIHSDPGDPWEGRTLDRATYRERVRYSRTGFPDLRFLMHDVIATEQRVAVRWSAEGTHRGDHVKTLSSTPRDIFLVPDWWRCATATGIIYPRGLRAQQPSAEPGIPSHEAFVAGLAAVFFRSTPRCSRGGPTHTEGWKVKHLSPEQRALVSSLTKRLRAIRGIRAVVLGGSPARGRAQPGSDIDLGLLDSEAAPFAIQSVRELAEVVKDTTGPVVTNFYQWGPWVNGGTWLTIGGQRVDFVYRSLEHLERVLAEAEAGRYELHYAQQPPFGFFSATYLGEIAVCVPLFDPEARLDVLKRRVADYPEALRRAVVQDYLWAAEFGLASFARKFATRSDGYGTAACLTRAVNQLVLVLFTLNRE
jgi:hypothetical protein